MGNWTWILIAVGVLLLAAGLGLAIARRRPRVEPLPTDWALTPRPVFSTDERRIHKLLREALPNHIVLAKLPLVRFCQPVDAVDVRYWFNLLGATHVTFAVCSPNGRVLAAVDLENDRANSRRVLQIKQSVLGACRVRYLRCRPDNLPSPSELQVLVPASSARSTSVSASTPEIDEARDALSSAVASRRAERGTRWHDSASFNDSFFAPDSRLDGFGQSEYGGLSAAVASRIGATLGPVPDRDPDPDRSRDRSSDRGSDIGGVVVDGPSSSSSPRG